MRISTLFPPSKLALALFIRMRLSIKGETRKVGKKKMKQRNDSDYDLFGDLSRQIPKILKSRKKEESFKVMKSL